MKRNWAILPSNLSRTLKFLKEELSGYAARGIKGYLEHHEASEGTIMDASKLEKAVESGVSEELKNLEREVQNIMRKKEMIKERDASLIRGLRTLSTALSEGILKPSHERTLYYEGRGGRVHGPFSTVSEAEHHNKQHNTLDSSYGPLVGAMKFLPVFHPIGESCELTEEMVNGLKNKESKYFP